MSDKLKDNSDFLLAVESYWELSVKFYTVPGVQDLLLSLQNRQRKNVNYLLFALWFSYWKKRQLLDREADSILLLCRQTESWVARVREIRFSLQRQWRLPYFHETRKFREKLLNCELTLEKIHQRHIIKVLFEITAETENFRTFGAQKEVILSNLEHMCGKTELNNSQYMSLISLWDNFVVELSS